MLIRIQIFVLIFKIIDHVIGNYVPDSYIENIFDQAAQEYRLQNNQISDIKLINKGNMLRKKRQNEQKDASSLHLSVLKTTPETQKIHESFKIALKASNMLQKNTTVKQTSIKLRAPPKFCPFAFEPSCSEPEKYRKIDGSCNNQGNSLLGKASTPFKRLLRTAYQDSIQEPRQRGENGDLLPNPREIALKIHDPLENPAKISHFGVIFGQFIDHDFALSAATGFGSSPLKCFCFSNSEDCVNIPTPDDDIFDDQRCQVLTRSAASFDKFDCSLGAREQLNTVTHWLDLSHQYGSNDFTANNLRSFIDGKLKTIRIGGMDGEFMPNTKTGTCVDETNEELCFEAGDTRTSQNLALVSIHTIWVREHNRVALELKTLNPQWNDEDLFQEARRIVIAEYQNVIYKEWLPNLIGEDFMNLHGLKLTNRDFFMGYDPDTNPHLSAEFSTAAFRFGHTLVRSTLTKTDNELRPFLNFTLGSIMLRPTEAYVNGGLDSICRGLLTDPGTSFDPHFTDELQHHLFETGAFNVQTRRFSLSSINIMRGRDHGLPPYNDFRKFVGLNEAKSFDELLEIPENLREKLKRVYSSVNDIDAFTGGTCENSRPGALLGPTFAGKTNLIKFSLF